MKAKGIHGREINDFTTINQLIHLKCRDLEWLKNEHIAVAMCNVAEASQNTYSESASQPFALS